MLPMKAVVFDGTIQLKEIPEPQVRQNEALVKVHLAGICNTDLEISRGYMSFRGVLGHEFVGTVERSPQGVLEGSRVVGEINAGCGACPACAQGLERHCPNRTVLGILGRDGAMAEYLTLPVSNLVAIPDTVDDEKAVFIEPIAAALEILEQVRIQPADSVLVIGDGKLGMLICMVLRLTGCNLTVVGKHPDKLALLKPLGVQTMPLNEFSESSETFDAVVEASGNQSGWELAVKHLRPRGTLILKSTYHGEVNFNPAPLVINEITVVGSRCGQFAPAVRLLHRNLIDPTPLISGVYPLDRAEEALKRSADKDTFKILLKM
jgi:threonine dehydrogenase-like Zn-dependent dehydrogenase